jgi:type 1 glutamine amidotransferase
VGVHSATDTEYDWPWYGQLVGAYFKRHPAVQEAKLDVRDRTHLATKCLPATWTRRDEWYDFRAAPPADATILLTIDEKSYSGGTMGDVHPMSWAHNFDGGRAFYTELGHTNESYKDQLYLDHLAGGILWAIGR